jgi:hypothetical protein
MLRSFEKIIFFAAAIILICASFAVTETFVNWRGGYHITYPDDWRKVAYGSVNFFLSSQDISVYEFDYDAVISKKSDQPFFEMPYIFISHEFVEQLNNQRVDSILGTLTGEYKGRYKKISDLPGDMGFGLSKPIFVESIRTLIIKSRVTSEHIDKILLEMWRFHDKGIAIFLCYSPKEMYEESRPIFLDILRSFSTENLEEMAPKDSFEVVDLSQREASKYDESDFPPPGSEAGLSGESRRAWLFVGLGVVVLVIIGVVVGYLKSR